MPMGNFEKHHDSNALADISRRLREAPRAMPAHASLPAAGAVTSEQDVGRHAAGGAAATPHRYPTTSFAALALQGIRCMAADC